LAFQDPFIIAKEQVRPYIIPAPIPFYVKPKRGRREKHIIPIISIIGNYEYKTYKLIHIIANLHEQLININTTISGDHSFKVPIKHLIAETETIQHQLTQEIISQQTLTEIEAQLENIIKKAKDISTDTLEDKIKILAQLMRNRNV